MVCSPKGRKIISKAREYHTKALLCSWLIWTQGLPQSLPSSALSHQEVGRKVLKEKKDQAKKNTRTHPKNYTIQEPQKLFNKQEFVLWRKTHDNTWTWNSNPNWWCNVNVTRKHFVWRFGDLINLNPNYNSDRIPFLWTGLRFGNCDPHIRFRGEHGSISHFHLSTQEIIRTGLPSFALG